MKQRSIYANGVPWARTPILFEGRQQPLAIFVKCLQLFAEGPREFYPLRELEAQIHAALFEFQILHYP